jgi:iron complex outermembrane receptor protein
MSVGYSAWPRAILAVFGMGFFATSTVWAAAESAPGSALEEIVVTAQKKEENLQKVPVAVTAISGDTLNELHAVTLKDLQGQFPSVQLGSFANNQQSPIFSIRGIGVIEPDPYAGNTVAVVVDGVPQFFNYGALLDLFDIQRIEILRGPQGTLFGANTTGGVINVVTAQPTNEFGGNAVVTIGNLGRRDTGVSLNLPLNDAWVAKIVGFHSAEDGFIKNVFQPNDPIGKKDRDIARGYLRFKPSSDFDATLTVEYDRTRDGAGYIVNGALPGEALYQTPGVDGMYPSVCSSLTAVCSAPRRFVSGSRVPDQSDMDIYNGNFTLNWRNTPIGDITAVSGYKHFSFLEFVDQAGGVHDVSQSDRYSQGFQVSQEIRTAFKFNDRINSVFGAYYLRDHYFQDQNVAYSFIAPGFLQETTEDQTNWSASVFNQNYFQLTDKLQLTIGERYQHEATTMTAAVTNFFGTTRKWDGSSGVNIGGIPKESGNDSWNNFGGKIGLNYQINDDILTYFSFSRGFKSGGFVGRIGIPSDIGPYGPEHVDAYELGLKSDFFEKRLRTNVALFYTRYKDMQIAETIATNRSGVNRNTILNAGRAEIKGVEAEITAIPVTGLILASSASYIRAVYTSFPNFLDTNAGKIVDLTGTPLMNTPKWSAHEKVSYQFALGKGLSTASVDYSFVGSKFQTIIAYPRGVVQPTHLIGANFDWAPDGKKWTVGIWGHNLANRVYFGSAFQTNGYGALYQYLSPREYGVSFKINW